MKGKRQAPRDEQQLLELSWKRVTTLRLAIEDALTVLRPDDCKHCLSASRILRHASDT